MIFTNNEKIYNITIISQIKQRTGLKKLKKIRKYLKNLAEEDLKTFSKLKIKIFEEKKEKNTEFIIIAPIIGFQHYFEDFKKSTSKQIVNKDVDYKGENTPSTVDDNEEENQVDSSDFSEDE